MRTLILFLLIVGLLVFPACAYSSTVVAPTDEAFEAINFYTPVDNTGTIDITLANGETISATWSYISQFPVGGTGRMNLNGEGEVEFGYLTPGSLRYGVWGTGNVSNINQIRMGFGQFYVYNSVTSTDIEGSPIISYTINADSPVTEEYIFVPLEAAEAANSPEAGTSILDALKDSISAVLSMFLAMMWWLKFLFVDNLLLIFALYFTGTMAYAANTSRSIFQFYKTWFRQQRAIFEFMANSLSLVISIATNTIQAVLKWI